MPSVSGRDSFPLGHKADGAALGLSCDVGFELLAGVYASSGAFEINADGMTITVFTLPFQSQGKHAHGMVIFRTSQATEGARSAEAYHSLRKSPYSRKAENLG